jgi:molybdenum storage protein
LTAEAFGAHTVIYVKDQDGLYTQDPATNPDARLLPEITAGELQDRGLHDLPLEPIVIDMLASARLVKRVQLINGLTAGMVTRAVRGEPVGTVIAAD